MEAKAIQKFFPDLISAVGTCVQNVSDCCFSESLIEETTHRKVLELASTDADKARILMVAVRESVARNPSCFGVFVSVLKKVLPGVDDPLLKAIKAAVDSNVNEVEEPQIPSVPLSQTVCGSSDSTAAPRSETYQSELKCIHKGYTHALKGAEESDSMTSAISEDMIPNNMHQVASSELSDNQIAVTMITSTDIHQDTFVPNQSYIQTEEAAQGVLLCKMIQTDTQFHNSNGSNESSVVEVQGDYKMKSNQDFEDLQCTSASQSTKSTQTSSDSTSNSNSRDRIRTVEDLKHVMRVDLKQIRKRFVKLQSDVRVSLRRVPLDDIIAHILGYVEVFDPESEKKVPLLPEEKLREAPSTDQLFNKIQKQWNFLEFDLLESIVEQCCDEPICKQVKEYHNDLKEFFEKRKMSEVSEDLSLSNCMDETQEQVIMKLDLNDPTLKEIKDLKSRICEILGVMPSTLLISGIRPGCVEITFLIPGHISEYVFGKPITETQCEALKAASVLEFRWRNRTEIFAEEEHLDDLLVPHQDDTSSTHLGRTLMPKEADYKKEGEALPLEMIANRFKPISDYGRLGGLSDSIADAFTLLFAPAHVPEPSLKLSYTPSSLMLMLIYHTTMKRLQELYLSFKSNYKDDERDSDYESEIDSCEVVDMTGISEDRRCPMTHIIETPSASCHACSHLDPEKVSTTGEKGMREIIIVSPEKRYPRYIEMEGGLKTKQYTNMMKNWRYWISNDQWNKMYLAEQKYIDLLDVPGEQLYVLLAGLLQSVIARMVKQHYAQAINLLQKCECLCLRMEGNNSTFLHGRCKYTWSWLYRYLKQYEAAKECSRNAMQILFYVEPGEDKALANYGYAATIVDLQSTTKCPDQDEIQSAESYLQCAIDYAHIEDCGLEYVAPHSQLRLAQMYLHSTLYEPGKNTDPESIRKANSCLKAIDKGSLHPRSRCIFFLTESDLYRCKGDITMAKESAKQALMTAKENYFGEIMAAETRIKSLGLATSTKSFLVQ